MFDLFNVRLVYKEIYKLVNENSRFKSHLFYSRNTLSNKKWFDIIMAILDRFKGTLKNDIKIYDSNFELLAKYYIEKTKNDVLIPNVLSHMLFC